MRQYETMYILKAELDADQTAALVEKYQTLVTEHGGQIDQLQEIGKRRLAYEIQDLREGYYVLMQFSSDTDVTKELERVMKIEENLLRYMTVRLGE
jgi:small subunit ribosomal protein S6